MSQEILINTTSREVRVALLENGVLQDLLIDRTSKRGLVGNIYMGKVSRVLPGMQAAFVDIGIARTAFLHASDIQAPERADSDAAEPEIRSLLRDGEVLPVQVMKDPIGTKGARLTTFITIPSRFLVLLPKGDKVGVSARIENDEERGRLKTLMEDMAADYPAFGYIVRTAAEGASGDALRADMMFLHKLWNVIDAAAKPASSSQLIYEDLSLAVRVVRDLIGVEIERVRVDSDETFAQLQHFAETFMPTYTPVIERYTGHRPILDLYGVEEEIEKALGRKVDLKSGGCIILDQTEAMTTIDVNTGAYVGHRNLEETIFRTNLEAAVAIARQLRLRNLGGIIIIDFIDMIEAGHRQQVLDALAAALAGDHARTQISEHSALGLVEMTRKRTRESLEHILCDTCPTCEGIGFVKTPETICYEIFREIIRQYRQFKFKELVVLAHQDVVELLLDEEADSLAELEELTGTPIRLQTESMFIQDRFDVVLM
jgi:ribonuclease G